MRKALQKKNLCMGVIKKGEFMRGALNYEGEGLCKRNAL